MEFITDYKLENFILNTQWEDLPEEVQKRAVVCGIDLTIALLLGSNGQQFQAGLRMAREHYKEGKVPWWAARRPSAFWGPRWPCPTLPTPLTLTTATT